MIPKIWHDYDRALRQANRAWEETWIDHVASHEQNDHTIRRQRLIETGVIRPEGCFHESTLFLTTRADFLSRVS